MNGLIFFLCSPVRQSRVINVLVIYFLLPLFSPAVPYVLSSFSHCLRLPQPFLAHIELKKEKQLESKVMFILF